MIVIKLTKDIESYMFVFDCDNCRTMFAAKGNEVSFDNETCIHTCRCPVCGREVML